MTEDQRRAIQAFVHSAIVPLIEDVIVKKLGQAAIVLRDELAGEKAPEKPRDRETDRARFPDPDFNRWLDESISDCGHIVWHQVGDLADAWAAWEARPYYAKGRHPSVDSPEDELFNPEPPSNEVWPPDGAVWLAPVATDAPANPKLMQYAWGRSSLSSGQMAEAYQCIVSAAQDCGQVYRLPVTLPHPQPASEWKERALSAEADIERMTDAFNHENGPTFMGEPVLPPEKMVELEPGVKVPKWLLDDARRIDLYMKAHLPGPWRIGGIQSHDYPHPQPARGEAVAWARQSGDPNDDAFVISAKVKRLWLASNPKRVARYTRPLYTTHVPCWALPAVESALSIMDLQGYWHSDLAAFRDWLKEKSA